MAWVGLERYGRLEDAQRLAYRWLYMMTTAFVDFNGVVPEKVSVAPIVMNIRSEGLSTVRCCKALSHGGRRVWKSGC